MIIVTGGKTNRLMFGTMKTSSKFLKVTLLLLLVPFLTASTDHKFYVSITKIEYAEESQALQIISKIFIDDIESVLRDRYNPNLNLGEPKETEADTRLFKKYFMDKFQVWVNGEEVVLNYLGKEYDIDQVKVYIEIEGISEVNSIQVQSKILYDKFEEQQNIIHCKVGRKRRSLILEKENPKGVLNFD